MSVFKRPNRPNYEYDFEVAGVRFSGSTGCATKRDAEQFEKLRKDEAKKQAREKRAGIAAPPTLNQASDRFWLEVGQHYSGTYGKTVWKALGWLNDTMDGKTLLRDIGPDAVARAVAKRRGEGVENATVNRTVTELLRRVLLRARDQWEQPLPKLAKITWSTILLEETQERVRAMSDDEELSLIETMRADYRSLLVFYIVSGCRLSEAVKLRWRHVDWEAKQFTVWGKGRNGKPKSRVIPLTPELRAILSPLRDHHPDAVFTYIGQRTRENPNKRIDRTIKKGKRYPITASGMKTTWRRHGALRAGLVDLRLHDTRHTAATRLLRATGNLKLVQRLLGHQDIATTQRYAHLTTDDLAAGMNAVAQRGEKSRTKSRTGVAGNDS
jgi:integrase